MSELTNLQEELRSQGYDNLSVNSDETHVSGVVHGIDVSNASKSVPDGKNTGPFKTIMTQKNLFHKILKTFVLNMIQQ